MADPFALNDDGTAKDPAAFRGALRADPVKMEALEKEPDVAAIVLGEDVNAFQELIKSVFQVRGPCGGAGSVSMQRSWSSGASGARGGQEGDGPLRRVAAACLPRELSQPTHRSALANSPPPVAEPWRLIA